MTEPARFESSFSRDEIARAPSRVFVRTAFDGHGHETTIPARHPRRTWFALAFFAVMTTPAFADEAMHRPAAKSARLPYTVSKETTRITEPLRQDGSPNYAAALDAIGREGVTPENNAAVLYWRAIGARDIDVAAREAYFAKLGMEVPPDDGQYLRPSQRVSQLIGTRILTVPWTADDEPVVAEWIREHETLLELVVEGTRRPTYYRPMIGAAGDEEDFPLVAQLLPDVQASRTTCRLLVARAMWRLGDGKVPEAEEDLLACHRFARHIASGPTLIEGLIGFAIDRITFEGDMALAHYGGLTAEQATRYRNRLAELPPLLSIADYFDRGERYMFLDFVTIAASGKSGSVFIFGGGSTLRASIVNAAWPAVSRTVEWDIPLKYGNEHYDRFVETARCTDRAERRQRFAEIDSELQAEGRRLDDPLWLFSRAILWLNPRATNSELVGRRLVHEFGSSIGAVNSLTDRALMERELAQLAFALAAYRAERGEYPAELEQLARRHIGAIPDDVFNDEPPIYRRAGDRYLLYSVGPNGVDEEGRSYASKPAGDDIVIVSPRIRTQQNPP